MVAKLKFTALRDLKRRQRLTVGGTKAHFSYHRLNRYLLKFTLSYRRYNQLVYQDNLRMYKIKMITSTPAVTIIKFVQLNKLTN